MREGWHGDEYLVLFDESEVAAASTRYEISQFLPGFKVLGLLSWDDFIVQNPASQVYSIPTVPLDVHDLSLFSLPATQAALQPDPRFEQKIKWYVKPIVFGGDAGSEENIIWVSHEEHAELVKWWNGKYRSMEAGQGPK